MYNSIKKSNSLFLFFVAFLTALSLIIISGCSKSDGVMEDLPAFHNKNGNPLLVLAQQPDNSNTPESIKNNIEHIESIPFDGMFVHVVPWSWLLMDGVSVSFDDIDTKTSILKNLFTKFQYNFLYIFINFPGDLWNDEVWQITAQNFANMAKAAKENGLRGIVFDNEEYQERKWLNFGEDYQNPAYNLEEHAAQATLRGQQVMEAMVQEFPEIEVFNYHGPYLSEPKFSIPAIIMGQAASWDKYELLGPFFVGMIMGQGDYGTVIDGGEVYQYRTMEDFDYSYQVRKYDMASEKTDSWFIPKELRPSWAEDINISFGVYNRQWKTEYPMDATIMRTTLFNALSVTDKYVWYYTEDDNWLIPGQMPQEWIDVVQEVYNLAHGL